MDSSSRVDTSLDLNTFPLRDSSTEEISGAAEEPKSSIMELGITRVSAKEEMGSLVEELNRVSAENKKLTEMLTVMLESYNALRFQVDYISKNWEKELSPSRKRKSDNNSIETNGQSESSSTDEDSSSNKKPREEIIKPNISKVYIRTETNDSSPVVKDGYQWRKYGQKVTRDNPYPRAYFKCSFAPSCPVKKKVQRNSADQSVVVATYEGEHNHPHLSQMEPTSGSSRSLTFGSWPCSTNLASRGLDLTKSNPTSDHNDPIAPKQRINSPEIRQLLVEQMASSLTKDPNFTAALAAAVSGKMFQQN